MILKTTIGNLDEFTTKYSELFYYADGAEVQEDDNTKIYAGGVRIQIPELNIALRDGDLMSKQGGSYYYRHDAETGEDIEEITPPPEDADWEVDASVVVICELSEKDPAKYLGWTTDGYQGAVCDFINSKDRDYDSYENVECFVDTSEFIEDEEEAERVAAECEENYEEEYEE